MEDPLSALPHQNPTSGEVVTIKFDVQPSRPLSVFVAMCPRNVHLSLRCYWNHAVHSVIRWVSQRHVWDKVLWTNSQMSTVVASFFFRAACYFMVRANHTLSDHSPTPAPAAT